MTPQKARQLMTPQKARQQVEACESEIKSNYKKFHDAAQNMGSRAVQVASSRTSTWTALPLVICLLFSLVLNYTSHPVWGTLLLIAGIFITFYTRSRAKAVQAMVEGQRGQLKRVIDENKEI